MSALAQGAIAEAYDQLKASNQVQITKELAPVADEAGAFEFEWTMPTPQPNVGGLPASVCLRTVIPAEFPEEETAFYPVEAEARSHPHQCATSGKLCLSRDRAQARDARRLGVDIRSASEWILDAASGDLAKPGQPYELPDFGRREGVELPAGTTKPFLFVEDEDTFHLWKDRVNQHGRLKFAFSVYPRAGFALEFSTAQGEYICCTKWPGAGNLQEATAQGRWILLENLCFERHRPPQTFGELALLCQQQAGIDFYEEMYQAWKQAAVGTAAMILVGYPIPQRYGEPVCMIHWQPLFFPNKAADSKKFPGQAKKLLKGSRFWEMRRALVYQPAAALPWGKSINVAAERLYARGGRQPVLREPDVALFGGGSVGGALAQTLARGGVDRLDIFDPESFEPGNACRHPLGGESFGLNKALQLAKDLGAANPLSRIRGHMVGAPLTPINQVGKGSDYHKAWRALLGAELWIDCTGDDDALRWLSQQARKHRVALASIFLTFRAEYLVVCLSGKQTSCGRVFRLLTKAIQDGTTPLPRTLFDPPPPEEEIIEGAGCWHPTFPATNSQVNVLVNSAVEVLEELLQRKRGCDGHVVVLQRHPPSFDFSGAFQASALIEVAWASAYR